LIFDTLPPYRRSRAQTGGKTTMEQAMKADGSVAWLRAFVFAIALMVPGVGRTGTPDAAEALHLRHAALRDVLARNEYQRPLYLDSTEAAGNIKGDVYVVVAHPFDRVVDALRSSDHWCDILILHLNAKYCRPSVGPSDGKLLHVGIGRKFDQPLADAYRVNFVYRLLRADDELLQVGLEAVQGPMGTRNYRILLEAVPLDGQRSFIHLSYAYSYGVAARLAMQAYLATLGSAKVGFTVVDRRADGQPVHVGGVRGAVERNTMRYSLAIEAYLGAYTAPPEQQLEKRLRDWFASTERYALQLHEIDQNEYLEMKRREVVRQQQTTMN
jgi:hypothetical protein